MVIDYIPQGRENAVSRQYLKDMTGMTDRQMRRALKDNGEVVLNFQDGRGYFRPSPDEDNLVRAWIRQELSRVHSQWEEIKKAQKYLAEKAGNEQLTLHDILGW